LGSKNEERCRGLLDVNSFILIEKCWTAIYFFDFDYDVKLLGSNNIAAFDNDVLNTWADVRKQTS